MIAGFFLIGIVLTLFPYQSVLVFSKQHTNELIAYTPMNEGDRFQIIYTHSIHLTDVIESYLITEDRQIEQYEMSFEEFGIGMPSRATGAQQLIIKDGRYYLTNMTNRHSYLPIRVADVVPQQRFLWNDGNHLIWFKEYFEPQSYITVEMKKLSLWQLRKGVKLREHNE